jgi:nitrate/TMAO reductase-like tetraheme cytochrome c subunit
MAPIVAQHVPQANGDTRQVVALTPSEAEIMLTGMRTYLETIQGIVAALHSSDIAAKSGARMLDSVAPTTGLKVPLDFTMISLDTHDKFDKLADKMRRGTSRTEVLSDMRNIMSNCISCHASYRLAP